MMKIKELINEIDVISAYIPDEIKRRTILSLCHDSRQASPTCAFFCKVGAFNDGHIFARNAYCNGARIFVAEKELDLPDDAAVIITPSSNDALSKMAVKFYGDPAKELNIIGITGTKGKTTVALSAYYIAISAGVSAGYIGTNGIYYNGKVFETANTTPDVLELQKALREMLDDGVTTVMLEVSSQALWQKRIYGLKFHSCVFTNLYRDHIGGVEHPNFEHYRDCKRKLFTEYDVQRIIVNSDCEDSKYMLDGAYCKEIITTSASGNESCAIYAKNVMKLKSGCFPGISFECQVGADEKSEVFMRAPGKYSAENGLLIIGMCMSLGISFEKIVEELASLTIPGRFETIQLENKPNSLFVIDYAHNGASLKAVLKSLREYGPERIICLFGSVGGRTFERRRELGEVARDYADVIIVTSDNPNNENPAEIANEIGEAIGDTDKPVYLIVDRKKAIEEAVRIARPGDYVLLAGKGHETYQLIEGRHVPFSEKNILILADKIFSEI